MGKVGYGQGLCNCANSEFGGLHMGRGRYGKGMLNFFVRVLYNAYVVTKYELWSSMLWEKLAMVKDCVIVQIVNFFWGLHTDRGGIERGW